MSQVDDLKKYIKRVFRHLHLESRRTAAVTRLRFDLNALEHRRRHQFSRLGERLNELRINGRILDAGLVSLLQAEFDEIDRVNSQIQNTIQLIKEINQSQESESSDLIFETESEISEKGTLIDSFQVL